MKASTKIQKMCSMTTSCKEPTRWKRPWCWEKLRAGGKRSDRGWDGWMASHFSKLPEIVKGREAWSAAVHRVAKSWTQLSNWTTMIICDNLFFNCTIVIAEGWLLLSRVVSDKDMIFWSVIKQPVWPHWSMLPGTRGGTEEGLLEETTVWSFSFNVWLFLAVLVCWFVTMSFIVTFITYFEIKLLKF